MSKDIQCPYCEEWQEINHDDGYGYEEGEVFEQECSDCGKTFVFTTTIVFYYDAYKADCKNGGEHKLKPIHIFPECYGVGKMRCEDCDEVIMVDKEAHDKAVKEYYSRMSDELFNNDRQK